MADNRVIEYATVPAEERDENAARWALAVGCVLAISALSTLCSQMVYIVALHVMDQTRYMRWDSTYASLAGAGLLGGGAVHLLLRRRSEPAAALWVFLAGAAPLCHFVYLEAFGWKRHWFNWPNFGRELLMEIQHAALLPTVIGLLVITPRWPSVVAHRWLISGALLIYLGLYFAVIGMNLVWWPDSIVALVATVAAGLTLLAFSLHAKLDAVHIRRYLAGVAIGLLVSMGIVAVLAYTRSGLFIVAINQSIGLTSVLIELAAFAALAEVLRRQRKSEAATEHPAFPLPASPASAESDHAR